MPTIKSIIEKFVEDHRYDYKNIEIVLIGSEEYSLIMQEEIIKILDKNVIKTTKKELLNIDISSAITKSMNKMKIFSDMITAKNTFIDLVNVMNEKYGFQIDISEINERKLGTAEERYVYLLRQTEREKYNGERKTLIEISGDLGCSVRVLQKDIKKMTEQGFKLLGMDIKLVDNDQKLLSMESTPHPVILMQNISQLLVILEGLRSMEKIEPFRNFAESSAVDVWNQLTEYARTKILDAVEKLDDSDDAVKWYISIDKQGEWQNRFLTELDICGEDPESQLMYLMKNGKLFNLTYVDDENRRITLYECYVARYFTDSNKYILNNREGQYEIAGNNIVEVDII